MLIAGLVIHLLISLVLVVSTDSASHLVGMVLLPVVIAQWFLFVVYRFNGSTGALSFLKWSSVLWVPIGLITVKGVSNIEEAKAEAEFQARRAQNG